MDIFPLKVFYNLDLISNILSLTDVTSQVKVIMDTNNELETFVRTGPYSVLKFYQCQ